LSSEAVEVPDRLAIIVGIDKYEAEKEIPMLHGAENDANEIVKRLTTGGGGAAGVPDFKVPNNYFLIGKNATRRAILKAISDVFRRNLDNKLVLFYFSGHGQLDKNDVGYLAPYDMDPDDPYVSGIKIEDFTNVINKSKNNASVLVVLDCCYAGIATRGTRAISDLQTRNMYATQVKKLVQSPEQDNPLISGRGKFIFASSEADGLSREKNDCTDLENSKPHTHGVFSYHFIEGLDGKAADPETGVITIESLRKHIQNQMKLDRKQTPLYYVAEASSIESIKIAVSQEQFNKKTSTLIDEINTALQRRPEDSKFVDIQSLNDAAKRLSKLNIHNPTNKEIKTLEGRIDNELKAYEQPLKEWLTNNNLIARRKINEVRPGLYDDILWGWVGKLYYEELKNIDDANLQYLIYLITEAMNGRKYQSEDDKNLLILQTKLRLATYPKLGGA
jgi:hypothetical protein